MLTLIALCCFAFLAGFIDAMVGGGGLVQLPAMFILLPQLTLVQTLASNKTASFMGTLVATGKYIRHVKIDWKYLLPAAVMAFIGAFFGALMVSHFHKEQFMPFIICILTLVLIYTIFKKELGLHQQDKQLSKTRYYVYALLTGLIIGFYEGLIGPGTGSFLIFIFIVLFGFNFLNASANAKVINLVASFSALILFFIEGNIMWHIAIPVGICNMLGGYTGSHVALKKGSAFIRIFFILMVFALIVKLGLTYL